MHRFHRERYKSIAIRQRRFANYVFGAAWNGTIDDNNDYTADDAEFGYVSYGTRDFHKRDYNMDYWGTSQMDPAGLTAYDTYHPQMAQLTPNIWATQDAVFGLMQVSGFFLAFGIVFHILAFLMGGFIWNYSKACCDFGVCSFVFNSIVWSSLSLLCYMISVIAFSGIFLQGVAPPADDADQYNTWVVNTNDRLDVIWSVGGALILSAIVFSAIAISLASYQWAQDRSAAADDKMEEAVEQAVRRVSGRGV